MQPSQVAKHTLLKIARYSGVNSVVRHARGQSLLVLCYHGVVSDSRARDEFPYRNAVDRNEFGYQLSVLCHLFQPIRASDWIDHLAGRGRLPDRPVLVTFDDGYRNNVTNAAPLLERYGVPGLISVCAALVGTDRLLWTHELHSRVLRWPLPKLPMPGADVDQPLPRDRQTRIAVAEEIRRRCKQLADGARRTYLDRLREGGEQPHDDPELTEFLNWDEVRALRCKGWEIGSHTLDHPILARLTPDEMSHQLAESRAIIEREIGGRCESLAYPNGGPADVSPEVVARASRAGYRLGFMLGDRFSRKDDPLAISRMCVSGQWSRDLFHAQISGIRPLLRSTTWRSCRSSGCHQSS